MIYLDYAATTPVDPQVIKIMRPYYNRYFGNPSSLHQAGRRAAQAISQARQTVAKILNAQTQEIIFTAGGTESDNLAIWGVTNQFINQAKNYHLITSQIEHPAILKTFKALEDKGFQVTYLAVNKFGLIDPQQLMKALQPNTILVSIIYANNEVGTIQPISEMANVIKNYHHIQQVDKISRQPAYPVFHTDACQAAGYLNLNVTKLGVDLMTLNGSKIYGPKQSGILYKREAIKLTPLLYGGNQEKALRPGTENVPAIVGFAQALKIAEQIKVKERLRLEKLRDYLIKHLTQIPETFLNGHPQKRLPNNVNITFKRIEGESIVLKLDAYGICVSSGSACHSLSLEPSHVLLAMGQKYEDAHGSIRFSLGKKTSKEDLDKVIKLLPKIVKELRQITAIQK